MPTVRVAIRTRPEHTEHTKDYALLEESGSIRLTVGGQKHEFTFDHVFSNTARQEDVFNKCAVSICQDVLEGYNGSIFAYGQTGAGKTHTMSGPVDIEDYDNDRGLCMRVASYLFANSRRLPDTVTLRLSILEIYNEQLIDLLREPSTSAPHVQSVPKLSIVEIPEQGVLVPGLYVMPLSSEEDAFSFFLTAHRNRVVAEHQLNRNSSRSHVICTFYIDRVRNGLSQESRSNHRKAAPGTNSNIATDADPEMIQSKVHLIDLAGSERTQKTGSSGIVQKEANYINKSLSFLEQVVVALTQVKREHIPYRQSKLTHLLKDSLGGNCHTCLVACVWPHRAHDWETLSTLRFSSRMKNIENTPVRNNLTAREPASAALVKQVNVLKRELILRDHISGVESYLPALTFTQKATVMRQACDLVAGRISDAPAVDPREYGVPFAVPEDMEIRSVSHAQQLVGTLRAAIWEACDGDSTLVAEVMSRTSARLHASQQRTDALTTNSIESSGGHPLPRKEEWIYPSNFQVDDEDKIMPEATRKSNQGSSGNELPILPATNVKNRLDSKGSLLTSHSVHDDTGEHVVAADIDAVKSDVDGDENDSNDTAVLQNSVETRAILDPFGDNAYASTTGDTNSDAVFMHADHARIEHDFAANFEAFKLGPGHALHETYNDIRRTVHLEKNRQREVVSLLNRRKAEIDELMSSIHVYQKEEKALLQDHALTKQPTEETINASEEANASNDDQSGQLSSIQSVIAGMVNRLDAAKAEYRAAHMELQLCKQQIAETQILKKRAMNSIVGAYDKSALLALDQERA